MAIYDAALAWLTQPDVAQSLDPYVFAIPRLIDFGWMLLGLTGLDTQIADIENYFLFKKLTGGLLLIACLLWLARVLKKKSYHLLPLLALLAFWGCATIAGAVYGESLAKCLPTPDGNIQASPVPRPMN